MITRFAPSPTGYLHLGHAYAAIEAFGFARANGGTCLLRIEDIDHTRCRPHFEDAVYEDLDWLGFNWPKPVRVQSQHMVGYFETLEALKTRGLIYRCFKTRKEIDEIERRTGAPYQRQAAIMGEDRTPEIGQKPAWRLSLSAARGFLKDRFETLTYQEKGRQGTKTQRVDPSIYGDIILARRDIGVSYHLACCYDDAAQDITHVVRGADFAQLTGIHVLLQALMGWPTPIYRHHNLIMRDDGEKLSKRSGDTAIRVLRNDGLTREQVLDMAKRGAAS